MQKNYFSTIKTKIIIIINIYRNPTQTNPIKYMHFYKNF